jgi:hypothetical protein
VTEFEHLGEALRAQLHALAGDLTPSAELMAQVDAIPRSRGAGRRGGLGVRRRRIALALPVPIAAIIAAVVFLFGGSSVAPSYAGAILVLPNGGVRVTISQIMNVASANTELRAHHIHNMVVRPMSASCPGRPSMSYAGVGLVPAPRITLTPRTVARGWTIVIAAEQIGADKIAMAIGRFRGRLPTCVSSHGTGPGLGHWEPGKANRIK